ncbi:Zinc finger, RING-CH-type [Artemisia annua]|uniref:Zinc finger, RING-CH-type n=1 Tax=Artemisia annua TaxID=35608 RepID=A0A2U1LBN5_ARTAN|nr:Zinc finger, RING-CH-type [Artemisia annua]
MQERMIKPTKVNVLMNCEAHNQHWGAVAKAQKHMSRSRSVPNVNKDPRIKRSDSFFCVIPLTSRVKEADPTTPTPTQTANIDEGEDDGGEDIPKQQAVFRICFVELCEGDGVTPKGVLRVMGVQRLTIYHLKSHLQLKIASITRYSLTFFGSFSSGKIMVLGRCHMGLTRRGLSNSTKVVKVKKHQYLLPQDSIPNHVKAGALSHLSPLKPLKEKSKPITLRFEKPL